MKKFLIALIIAIILLSACSRPYSTAEQYMPLIPTYDPSLIAQGPDVTPVLPAAGQDTGQNASQTTGQNSAPTQTPSQPVAREPGEVAPSPTPDQPKPLPTIRTEEEIYTVQARDTLFSIAQKFGVDMQSLMEANNIQNANLVYVGQVLTVPAPSIKKRGTSFKVSPRFRAGLQPSYCRLFSGCICRQPAWIPGKLPRDRR